MKKIKLNMIAKLLFGILIITSFTACDEGGDPDPGATSTVDMAGDWWIVALNPDGASTAFGGDYVNFTTYNTSANDGTMWLDDHGNWFEIKTKINANLTNLTFAGEQEAEEVITGGKVTISNGKIIKNAFTAASGTKVDEISFEVEIDWAPGNVYIFKGHKRTGFLEDENPHYQP